MKTTSRIVNTLAALTMAAVLPGCYEDGSVVQFNLLRSIEIVPNQSQARGVPLAFELKGSGTCTTIDVDWGDGNMTTMETARTSGYHVDTDANGVKSFRAYIEHTFGWNGGKTVTATATAGCEGKVNTRFVTNPPEYTLGFARPGPNQCDVISGQPMVPSHTNVYIRTIPVNTRCGGIWYDNLTPHCYDAEGISTLAAPGSGFPFVGLKSYSLVLRSGTQVVQGGTNMSFTTTQTAPLEFCVNEPNPRDGNGGYEIHIRTDELGPPAS